MHGHGRLCGQSWHGAAPSQRWHGRSSMSRKRSPAAPALLVPCVHPRRSPILAVRITAAGHNELFATHPSRTAVTTLAGIDTECARLFISRACDAVRDPACSHSGSLTGSPGGCQCVRCRSNFKNLWCRKLLMDVVSTAVQSADAASNASRILRPRRFGILQQHFSSWGGTVCVGNSSSMDTIVTIVSTR
mgnify:CR=1 FL=1